MVVYIGRQIFIFYNYNYIYNYILIINFANILSGHYAFNRELFIVCYEKTI